MNDYTTKISKSYHGWTAETTVVIGGRVEPEIMHDQPGKRIIKLTTMKRGGGQIVSIASVAVSRPSACGKYATETFCVFQDYSKTVMRFPDIRRVTEKSIEQAHKMALALFSEHIAAAKTQYNIID